MTHGTRSWIPAPADAGGTAPTRTRWLPDGLAPVAKTLVPEASPTPPASVTNSSSAPAASLSAVASSAAPTRTTTSESALKPTPWMASPGVLDAAEAPPSTGPPVLTGPPVVPTAPLVLTAPPPVPTALTVVYSCGALVTHATCKLSAPPL